jgi:hypothetical protein
MEWTSRLLGCCVQRKNSIMVYEYLANNSLDHALKGENLDCGTTTTASIVIRSWSCIRLTLTRLFDATSKKLLEDHKLLSSKKA